ncbi:hypothetical protein ACFQYP_39305 [Nonomuraea antimicrobica]
MHDVDAQRLQQGPRAHAGQLQQLGVLIAPPHRMTSDASMRSPPHSTPTARVPSKSTFSTRARVRTWRLGRRRTGWR